MIFVYKLISLAFANYYQQSPRRTLGTWHVHYNISIATGLILGT